MKTMRDLYTFAEELIEDAIIGGDNDTAEIIEEAVDTAHMLHEMEEQLAEILMAFMSIEDRINVPEYPVESVIRLRMMLRGMNNATRQRYLH
jgi:hypothetical protein